LTGFWSAAQRNFLGFVNKTTQIDCFVFSRAAKNFGICEQKQLKLTGFFWSAVQRKILEFANKTTQFDWILVSRAAKILELVNKTTQIDWILVNKQLKLTVLCSAGQQNFLEFAHLILFSPQQKV
jgi:hypothetical protein